ncbi:hypothetical protein Anas_10397 [Armadillidium nasatum]|uniref:Uncharacterized protein n=1 Tax=Armadillidium nasatum TaxID=96803 RepID=A0A5N5TD44_9CRUS|nr:hypothetical protein Anas_10397 [Armadillidium nasatum]
MVRNLFGIKNGEILPVKFLMGLHLTHFPMQPYAVTENEFQSIKMVLAASKDKCLFVRKKRGLCFRLAEEFKVKGLSGPIGSDVTTKHDFDPPGVDVLNLNLFRKCVNPTKIRDVDILRCKISSLIQKTPRKSRMAESQLIGDFKVSKVKDNKYKIVGCNRTRIYDKEDSNANIHQDSSESAREREIFDQFSHISLVEDKAKTFTEEAVKDLVTRLTSHLKIKDQNPLMEGENQQLLLNQEADEHQQEKEREEEHDQKDETQLFEPLHITEEDNLESLVKFNHFGIDSISSAIEVSIIQQSKLEKYSVKTMNIPPVLGISTGGPTSAKEYYSCDLCSFTSAHQTRYSRHKKLHCLEGRQKFLSRIAQLRECPGIIKSKPAALLSDTDGDIEDIFAFIVHTKPTTERILLNTKRCIYRKSERPVERKKVYVPQLPISISFRTLPKPSQEVLPSGEDEE